MNIFMRTFNDGINSKNGMPLPPNAPRRGTPEWLRFQDILIKCLKELGHQVFEQKENLTIPDDFRFMDSPECDGRPLKTIYVHKTKREIDGDLYWMQMHARELFTMDTNGWGADNSRNKEFKPDEIDQQKATKFCELLSEKLLSNGTSKIDQPRKTDETPSSFILVPVQIPRDYTIKYHSPVTVRYFIESVQAWAIETETQVCFKMHPNNAYDQDLHAIVDEAQASSPYVHKVEGNIHELIRRSNGVLVVNSGTGFESLLHGKPVATIGNCDYNLVTLNADIRRLNEVSHFFQGYQEEYRQLVWKYVWWYWNKHAYDVNSPDTPSRLTEYLRRTL